MDITSLLGDKKNDLIATLVKGAGFGPSQAASFVPAATEAVTKAAGGPKGLDPKKLAKLDASEVIDKIDIGALASKVGVDRDVVNSGLKKLTPIVLGALRVKLGIVGTVVGVAGQFGGGLSTAIKGVGNLFKS